MIKYIWFNKIMKCNICPRKCNVNRDTNTGFCNANNSLRIAKYMIHNWEEPIISGINGSGAIFFSHCNLKCIYCQNYQISSLGEGKIITTDELINIIKQLESKGVHNINLVTPSHYTTQIIEALNKYKPSVPIVWNSNGYESVDIIKQIKDIVDIYLVDMKYMDNTLAFNLSYAKDYPEVCNLAILQMRKNQPKDIIVDGIMQKGIIVRHLVIPNEVENSFKVLDWINSALGPNTYVSIMGQYTPCYLAVNNPRYNRSVKPIEYKRVINRLNNLNFTNGFYQDLTSADKLFIPDFNKFEE